MTNTNNNLNYWSYPPLHNIDSANQIQVAVGSTPLEKLGHPDLPTGTNLFLKREDLNPNGSFKDRALLYQLSYLKQNHQNLAVISTSGNAGISACNIARKAGIEIIVLVSPDIPDNKLKKIFAQKPKIVIISSKASRFANYISRQYNIPNLKPSKDDNAVLGLETLGWEIDQEWQAKYLKKLGKVDAIFSFSTSGASILGMHKYFQNQKLRPLIISVLNKNIKPKRFLEINNLFENFNDFQPIIADNDLINKNLKLLHDRNIISSYEGAACLATYLQLAPANKWKNIVIVISGQEHEDTKITASKTATAETKAEIDQICDQIIKKQ